MKNLNLVISKNIVSLRRSAKMTQAELAEKLGYSDKAVSKWERADGIPDVPTLVMIAELFGTSVDYIISEQDGKPASPSLPAKRKAHIVITLLGVLCVWFLAVLSFIIIEMTDLADGAWLAFAAAIPLSATVLLVFNSIWGRMSYNFPIMSVLVWSALTFVFLLLPNNGAWMVYLIGIPLQIGILLWYALILPTRSKSTSKKQK